MSQWRHTGWSGITRFICCAFAAYGVAVTAVWSAPYLPDTWVGGIGHFHKGTGPLQLLRVAGNWDLPYRMVRPKWSLQSYAQLSGSYWHTAWRGGYAREQHIVAFSPVARLRYGPWYWEAGVGGAWVSHNRFANRQLITHGHFEDRIGMGWVWGEHERYQLGYVCVHYSNAGMSHPNNGLDAHILQLAVKW